MIQKLSFFFNYLQKKKRNLKKKKEYIFKKHTISILFFLFLYN